MLFWKALGNIIQGYIHLAYCIRLESIGHFIHLVDSKVSSVDVMAVEDHVGKKAKCALLTDKNLQYL